MSINYSDRYCLLNINGKKHVTVVTSYNVIAITGHFAILDIIYIRTFIEEGEENKKRERERERE